MLAQGSPEQDEGRADQRYGHAAPWTCLVSGFCVLGV